MPTQRRAQSYVSRRLEITEMEDYLLMKRVVDRQSRLFEHMADKRVRELMSNSFGPEIICRLCDSSRNFSTFHPISYELQWSDARQSIPREVLDRMVVVHERILRRRLQLQTAKVWLVTSEPTESTEFEILHPGTVSVSPSEVNDVKKHVRTSVFLYCPGCGELVEDFKNGTPTSQACACGAIRCCSNKTCLRKAAHRIRHDCTATETVVKMTCLEIIRTNRNFPFCGTVMRNMNDESVFGCPIDIATAINDLVAIPSVCLVGLTDAQVEIVQQHPSIVVKLVLKAALSVRSNNTYRHIRAPCNKKDLESLAFGHDSSLVMETSEKLIVV